MDRKKSVFIATPISGFHDEIAYKKYRETVVVLIEKLRKNNKVYSEIERIIDFSMYDKPQKSVMDDFENIVECDVFLLLHPIKMQTSSMIEFGFACALRKNIIIVSKPEYLPYLAIGYVEVNKNATIIKSDIINNDVCENVCNIIDVFG